MNKVIRDGMVAVLVSPGFGAGWSTWANEHAESLMFDPTIVDAIENNLPFEEVEDYLQEKYPDEYFGGYDQLVVYGIPEKTKFRITEYDGSEDIMFADEDIWVVA